MKKKPIEERFLINYRWKIGAFLFRILERVSGIFPFLADGYLCPKCRSEKQLRWSKSKKPRNFHKETIYEKFKCVDCGYIRYYKTQNISKNCYENNKNNYKL